MDKNKKIEVLNPQDDKVIDTVPSALSTDVLEAYNAAEESAKVMRKLSSYTRVR